MVFSRKRAWFAKIFAGAQARPTLRTPLHEILDPPLMSDQASTQKVFNRLVKERADLETEERGLLETTDALTETPIEACSQGKITNTRTMVTCTLSNKQNGLFLCSVGSVLLL